MRLIDAELLICKQANIAKNFAKSDAQKSLMGRVLYNTDHAPTIDAIPVFWLYDKRFKAEYVIGQQDERLSAAISLVLEEWESERGQGHDG